MSGLVQWLVDHADKVPFALAAAGSHQPKISFMRILEAAIIAAVIGGMGYFFMVPRVIDGVKNELNYQRRDIDKNTKDIKENRDRLDMVRSRVDRAHGMTEWRREQVR